MIYKISSWFFAGLTLLSTAMFFITHHLAGETIVATAKGETKGATGAMSGDIIPNIFGKLAGVFLPMMLFSRIKSHFKAIKRERRRKRNRFFAAIALIFILAGIIKKK